MAGEIIRLGDSTSHGGTVIEGSAFDICMGKPIAYVGHMAQCPKCKGAFPIIEGALTTTFYGKGVALAGMRTACGAVLIASQFTDIVDYGGGSASNRATSNVIPGESGLAAKSRLSSTARVASQIFDDKFVLVDAETGLPILHTEYAIRRGSGELEFGRTDDKGHTHW